KQLLVGIGGSATNDGGFGLARALEWRFVDNHGHPVERWTELHRLSCVHASELRPFENITVAVDVQNPLLGPHGATRVYGPQKGLRPDDFELAERCLGKLAQRLRAVDLVITAEGAIDESTLMGKGVGQLARQSRASNVPCIGLAGNVIRSRQMKSVF